MNAPLVLEDLPISFFSLMAFRSRKVKRLRMFKIWLFIVTVFVTSCFFLYFEYFREVDGRFGISDEFQRSKEDDGVDFVEEKEGGCDLFDGKWIYDESYPLYESKDCNFLDEGFRCSENGRPDYFYTKWRWQPKHCNLPRYTIIN